MGKQEKGIFSTRGKKGWPGRVLGKGAIPAPWKNWKGSSILSSFFTMGERIKESISASGGEKYSFRHDAEACRREKGRRLSSPSLNARGEGKGEGKERTRNGPWYARPIRGGGGEAPLLLLEKKADRKESSLLETRRNSGEKGKKRMLASLGREGGGRG